MPNISTYIRKEDYASYLAIQSRSSGAWSEFIHQALKNGMTPPTIYMSPIVDFNKPMPKKIFKNIVNTEPDFHLDVKAGQTSVATKIIKTPEDAKKAVEDFPGYISKSYSARKKK